MRNLEPSFITRISDLLEYRAAEGVFLWKISPSYRVNAGDIAGHLNARGYVHIQIANQQIAAHRAAWALIHGEWPKNQIDHIDGNKSNNRIANLRDISAKENTQNQRRCKSSNLSSGLLGVSRNRDKWQAQIKTGGVRVHIGTYDTPQLAHLAYLEAKRLAHPSCTI